MEYSILVDGLNGLGYAEPSLYAIGEDDAVL